MQLREPTSENPITMDKLTVYPDNFIHKDTPYDFNQIIHIDFTWTNYSTKNAIDIFDWTKTPSGTNMSIEMELAGVHGKIESSTATWILHTGKKLNEFYSGYVYLARNSFNRRLQVYSTELEQKRYFTYNNAQFYPDGKVINKHWSRFIKEAQISKDTVKLRNTVLTITVKKMIVNRSFDIFLNVDRDVFFYLFEKLYGLRWK